MNPSQESSSYSSNLTFCISLCEFVSRQLLLFFFIHIIHRLFLYTVRGMTWSITHGELTMCMALSHPFILHSHFVLYHITVQMKTQPILSRFAQVHDSESTTKMVRNFLICVFQNLAFFFLWQKLNHGISLFNK